MAADPFEAINVIQAAGGRAVLAHPAQYNNFALLPDLVKAGLWGLDARHPAHGQEATRRCLTFARALGLRATGGSDYHGVYSGNETVGQCAAANWPL